MVDREDPRIQYGDCFGLILGNDKFFDDCEALKNDILNYKIINIKIYFNSCLENQPQKDLELDENQSLTKKEQEEDKVLSDEKYIIGLSITYKNIVNGDTKVIEHKCSDKIAGMRELNIKGNEYLKRFNMNINNKFERISQLCFFTNRNNYALVGLKDGDDKIEKKNEEDNVIVGCFGHYSESITALGCIYVNKKFFIEKLLFGFFLLRRIVRSDEKFREKWNKKYKQLDIDFQYIWRMINLPDASFANIIQFCFL